MKVFNGDWIDFRQDVPVNGQTVLVKCESIDPHVATYCEGDFYKLSYDPVVGCLRKMPVLGVKSWASIEWRVN